MITLNIFANRLFIGLVFSGGGLAQNAQAPCGPAGQLDAEFAPDVGADARCFELRMYTAQPEADGSNGIRELHQRFREEEVGIFERLGAEVVAIWQRLDDPNTLVWMLAYRDRAHRQEVWQAFVSDPAWLALREKYPVRVSIEAYMMSSTDYSNLK
ncbi:MAG: NIPSNAP family protein [Sphingomonadales bacterium]|nr:NIPSNAP family protein [Sphingomonadales bacterium]